MRERRRERLSSFIEEELPDFFRNECVFPLNALVSVLHVEVSETGSKANIFVSVFPDEAKEGVAKELKMRENEAAHFVRTKIRSKHSPVIRFVIR